MSRYAAAAGLLDEAVLARGFPAATAEAGTTHGVLWRHATGRLTYEAGAPRAGFDTVFDLASLTKVLATTAVAMRLVARGRLALETRVADVLPAFTGDGREAVTVADLLEHAAGLPGWKDLFRRASGPGAMLEAIAAEPLAYPPRSQSIYSDLGFILLGLVLEKAGGTGLAALFAGLRLPDDLRFLPPPAWRPRTAPTEDDPWRGRLLAGEVHDENAAAMGGVAGHAGLFGTAPAVGAAARLVLRTFREPTPLGSPALLARFARRTAVPGSSRALGWDTMLPTSSCGTHLSTAAIGHTGFTGASLWIDPVHDLYVVLLTNRVHPRRPEAAGDLLSTLRPRFHDAVAQASGVPAANPA